MDRRHVCVVFGCFLLAPPASLFGSGIIVFDHDTFATARGDAFTAAADNPSAIYYNPSGIAQLPGQQFRVGIYAVTYQTNYRSPTDASSESQRGYVPEPQFYYTYSLSQHSLSVGVGVYVPFGLSMKWPETAGFRQVAVAGTAQYLTLQPVIAWRLTGRGGATAAESSGQGTGRRAFEPGLSLAIGPTLNYSRADLKQGLSPFAGNDYFRFKGDAFAPGFSAGLRWQPLEQHAFGVVYRSSTRMDYAGHTDTTSLVPPLALRQDARAKFDYPHSVTAGWSWRPVPQWDFEFDANWTDWSSFSSIPIRQAVPVPPITLNWESSWYFAWGATRKFDDGWRASAGYIFAENSVPSRHFTPLVPDTDRHAWSVGIGHEGARWNWDLAYQLTRGTSRTVTDSVSVVADGRYDWWSHALSVSVGRKF